MKTRERKGEGMVRENRAGELPMAFLSLWVMTCVVQGILWTFLPLPGPESWRLQCDCFV